MTIVKKRLYLQMQEFLWKTYLESVAQPNVPIEQAVAQQAATPPSTSAGIYHLQPLQF